jgi:phage baseplate assembly protein gpV
MASVDTGPYYKKGRWQTAVEENWVTEWFLWHSFRFRDNRNHQLAVQEHQLAVQQPTGGRATGGVSGSSHGGESPYEESTRNKCS